VKVRLPTGWRHRSRMGKDSEQIYVLMQPRYEQTSRQCSTLRATSRGLENGLSGEALSMFHDAQRNILELNKSRLMALDELKQAKERIRELGVFHGHVPFRLMVSSALFVFFRPDASTLHIRNSMNICLHLT
jgi:hypothetical protein